MCSTEGRKNKHQGIFMWVNLTEQSLFWRHLCKIKSLQGRTAEATGFEGRKFREFLTVNLVAWGHFWKCECSCSKINVSFIQQVEILADMVGIKSVS